MQRSKVAAVIVAAGSGSRAGEGGPKQWRRLRGQPVARWSAETLAARCARVVVVVRPGDRVTASDVFAGLGVDVVEGAATRNGSVRAGLSRLAADPPELVFIHDAARPFLTAATIDDLINALDGADAVAPALPVADTLKRVGDELRVSGTAPREGLWRVQTPQAFRWDVLDQALAALPEGADPTDDLAVVEQFGGRVRLVPGDPMLFKLTYPEDFQMAERLAGEARMTRIGLGVDAHRLGPGDGVWLCGVKLPADRALIGHSDADAGLHALTDALLGAIGAGDIGEHFPPTDPQWRGAASSQFLRHAADLAAAQGGRINNVDVTLICEHPKIKPHREAMRARIAEVLGLPLQAVSVKATTTEGMGFTGREEGVLAQAVVSVDLPA
jgi:2-C-methyl-D-erythritol 4-phosphate cytidylyltransferase/2-C-methyl-D-erythritol 2,4-cyclodiphosphate synthase